MGTKSPGFGALVTWSSLPGKPSTFAPAAHTHAWADVTGKPSTFPPSAHTHLWADITDRPTIPAATPLSDATPLALAATAVPGSSTSAARGDHRHPLPTGRWEYIGDISVTETLLVSLAVGMKRKTFALVGVAPTDRLALVATGAPTAGCEAVNAYPAGAGNVSVGYYTPLLGIGATYTIPIAVYRVTT